MLKTLWNNQDSLLLWTARFVVAFALAAALPAILIPLGLPPEGDALDYRIPIIKWMIRHGAYPNWPWSNVDDYPMLLELLMIPLYLIHPGLVRLVPIIGYTIFGFFGGKILSEFFSDEKKQLAFWMGFAWLLALRPAALQGNLLMTDTSTYGFAFGAVYFILRRRFFPAGVFFALALATRYIAWPLAIPFAVFSLLSQNGTKWSLRLKNSTIFFGISSLGALPFMIRNFFVNDGNPVFPLVNSLFQTENPVQMVMRLDGYGRGTDLISLLQSPFDVFVTNDFIQNLFDYTLGKLFFIQALVFLVVVIWIQKPANPRKTNPTWTPLAVFGVLQYLLWFYSSQQLRFLVPFIAIVNLYFAYTLIQRSTLRTAALVTLLGIFSIMSIQKDSILMASGRKPHFLSGRIEQVRPCLEALPKGAVVGHIVRDGVLGFFNYDFRFLKGHPYSLKWRDEPGPYPLLKMEEVDFIFGADAWEGYAPYPADNPCLLGRIKE